MTFNIFKHVHRFPYICSAFKMLKLWSPNVQTATKYWASSHEILSFFYGHGDGDKDTWDLWQLYGISTAMGGGGAHMHKASRWRGSPDGQRWGRAANRGGGGTCRRKDSDGMWQPATVEARAWGWRSGTWGVSAGVGEEERAGGR